MKKLYFVVVALLFFFVLPAQAQSNEQQPDVLESYLRQAYIIGHSDGINWKVLESGFPADTNVKKVAQVDQIVIAIDNSSSMKRLLPQIIKKLPSAFPEKLPYPVMLVSFNKDLEVVSEFSQNRDEILKVAEKIKNSDNRTAIFKMIGNVQDRLGENKVTHLIMLTDGEETVYQIARLQEILKGKQTIITYVNWGLRDGRYSSVENATDDDKLKKEQDKKDDKNIKDSGNSGNHGNRKKFEVGPDDIVASIAQRTGGDVVSLSSMKQLVDYLKRWLTEGGVWYQVSWQSHNLEASFKVLTVNSSAEQVLKTYPRHW